MSGARVVSCVAVLYALQFSPSHNLQAQPERTALDTAFERFWNARTSSESSAAANQLIETGIDFDAALLRLKQGRSYSGGVATGIVRKSLHIDDVELFHVLNVPESYDPSKKYPVRFQLHGGVVARTDNQPLGPDTIGMLAGGEQIYVIPYAWRDAPWWSRTQLQNLRAILDTLKRTYNIDENRVVVSGVSDGGTGAYYVAMRDTTPYASFLPLNGFILVLANQELGVDGEVSPNNLRNKPLFIVNGALDPLYPTSVVSPFVEHLKKSGVVLDYHAQPSGEHNLRWWPKMRDVFEAFVEEHPRTPLPDRLTLETSEEQTADRRAHWLIIDTLGAEPDAAAPPLPLPDLNQFSSGPTKDFGLRTIGARVTRVIPGSNAAELGFQSTDYVVRLNDKTVSLGTELGDLLGTIQPGSSIQFVVARRNLPVELTGTFDPKEVKVPAASIFVRKKPTGRADIVRTGNTVEAHTSGVAAFTLLLSSDQFDFAQPVRVVANGQVAFEGLIQPDLATLLKWAAHDNDRTMLFGSELHINLAR